MATYKTVDADMLDGALSASADAIRAKTGKTASIPFDEATGFASAIAAIAAGGGGLKFWHGEIVPTSDATYMTLTHNLGSDKLVILAECLEVINPRTNYQLYRTFGWSPEILTPHIKYKYGDYTNEAYADESIPPTLNRTTSLSLSSGNSTAAQLQIGNGNRNMTNTMVHSADKNTVTWYFASYAGISRWAVTVIDISNCGIRFTEED